MLAAAAWRKAMKIAETRGNVSTSKGAAAKTGSRNALSTAKAQKAKATRMAKEEEE